MKKIVKNTKTKDKTIGVIYVPASIKDQVSHKKRKEKVPKAIKINPNIHIPASIKEQVTQIKRKEKAPKTVKVNPIKNAIYALTEINHHVEQSNMFPNKLSLKDSQEYPELQINLMYNKNTNNNDMSKIFNFKKDSNLKLASTGVDKIGDKSYHFCRISMKKSGVKRKRDDFEIDGPKQPPKQKRKTKQKGKTKQQPPKQKGKMDLNLKSIFKYLVILATINYSKMDNSAKKAKAKKQNLIKNIKGKLKTWNEYLVSLLAIIKKDKYKILFMSNKQLAIFIDTFIRDNHADVAKGNEYIKEWWNENHNTQTLLSFEDTYKKILKIIIPQISSIFQETLEKLHNDYEENLKCSNLYII